MGVARRYSALVLFVLLLVGPFDVTMLERIHNDLQDSRWNEHNEPTTNDSRFLKENPDGYIILNDTYFLHPGKTGGGSVRKRMVQWRLRFRECHPVPCPQHLLVSNLLVSVRDPVDRFVSAFNWRALVLCHLQNETRSPGKRDADTYPHLYCKSGQSRIIHETYKSNVNMLAEALCDSGIAGEQARVATKTILHIKSSLTDWIPSNRVEQANLVAVVLESGFDFIQQIDFGLKWLVRQSVDEEHAAWLSNNIENSMIPKEWLHSSSENDYHPPPLSPLGTCCLAQHLAEDYKLLQKLQKVACRESDSCREAIQSIHDRRKRFLDGSMSCQATSDTITF